MLSNCFGTHFSLDFSSHRQSSTCGVVVTATCATTPLSQSTIKTKRRRIPTASMTRTYGREHRHSCVRKPAWWLERVSPVLFCMHFSWLRHLGRFPCVMCSTRDSRKWGASPLLPQTLLFPFWTSTPPCTSRRECDD